MWYFSWILGVGLASTFGILNAMWFEMKQGRQASAIPVASDSRRNGAA
jgi:cyd operon protein YbgT